MRTRWTVSRISAVALTVAVVVAIPVQPAVAGVVLCAFDAPSATVTVTTGGIGDVQMHLVNGDELWVSSESCGGATTTDTDTVIVNASSGDGFDILLATGPFAPGKTDEGDGSSEIEFEIFGGPVDLSITGSSDRDAIFVGEGPAPTPPDTSNGALFDLNGDEAVRDTDVSIAYQDLGALQLNLRGGEDTFSGGGFAGAPAGPFAGPVWLLRGGGGDDVISPGLGPDGIYIGDHGVDTLSLAWLSADCDAILLNGRGEIPSSACNGATFDVGPFERIVGHAGIDWLSGRAKNESLRGLGGDDLLFATAGIDAMDGGPGRDLAIFDAVSATTADLRPGLAEGNFGATALDRIEDLVGSPRNDVLIGDGRGNELSGNEGDDLLKGKGGLDVLDGGNGVDRCLAGQPDTGELRQNCEGS